MDKYIIGLLDTNTRVIIPDFGAFIIKQKDPRLIVFNEFLRYNDGLLIEYVAKKENIEKDAAKKKVSEYVSLAGKNLKDNDEHLILGLGKLKKESTGKIAFEEGSKTAKKDTKKKESPKESIVKEEKKTTGEDTKKETAEKEAKAKEVPKVVPATEQKIEEAKKVTQEKPADVKTGEPASQEKPADVKAGEPASKEKPVEMRAGESVSKAQEKKEILTKPKPLVSPVIHKKVETRQRKRSNSQIIVWIILILVINAAIISWFVFNDEIRGFLSKDSGSAVAAEEGATDEPGDAETVSDEPSVPGEDIAGKSGTDLPKQNISEPVTAPEIEEESISLSEKRYYIVAGCFREENNANSLVDKLTQKGHDAEKFGKIGNLYAVSYASFIDRAEAQRKLRSVREEEAPEAWIVYY